MGRHLGLSEGLEMWLLYRSRAHMTSRTAQSGCDLQRGPGKAVGGGGGAVSNMSSWHWD